MARTSTGEAFTSDNAACEYLDGDLRRIIRAKARRLVAKSGMSQSDVPDVEQTLTAALVRAAKYLNWDRGSWQALAYKSLEHSFKKLLRDSFAQKRARRPLSLHVLVKLDHDEATVELSHLITRQDADRRRSLRVRDDDNAAQLTIDIEDFIKALPHELRELARSLCSESISEISRQSRVARSTIYDRVALLRQAAEESGLADYLK